MHNFVKSLTLFFFWFASRVPQNHHFAFLSHHLLYLINYWSMIASLSSFIQFKIVKYLLSHWRSNVIAAEIHCFVVVVYKTQVNLFICEQFIRFQIHIKDVFRRICKNAENVLIYYLENQFWTQQSEMIWYFWEKWNIYMHCSTVFRFLKKKEWSNKNVRRIDFSERRIAITLNNWFFKFDCETVDFSWWIFIQWNHWLTFSSIRFHWSISSISC